MSVRADTLPAASTTATTVERIPRASDAETAKPLYLPFANSTLNARVSALTTRVRRSTAHARTRHVELLAEHREPCE